MAGLSEIEWTDATWNPISGCVMISPGCTNCYAMRMAARLQAMRHPAYELATRKSGGRAVWTGRIHFIEKALRTPLSWRRPLKIFVNSMSDLFQDGVPTHFIERVWDVMEQANWHTYQILTKRPENMRRALQSLARPALPNVWLGTSVECAAYKGRIAELQRIPAQVRFISFEPLIGSIGRADLSGIHWAIVGGESGPHARSMKAVWVEEIRQQCKEQRVRFFFKQWGGKNKKAAGRKYLGRTWDSFPAASAAGIDVQHGITLRPSDTQYEGSQMSNKGNIFVERRPDGEYAVRRPNSERASDVLPTQKEAIERARELNPGHAPDVERVRHTNRGKPDQWRKA